MFLIVFSYLCIAAQKIFSNPANEISLINHRTVLMPPAGELKYGFSKCEPQWQTWIPWQHKDHSMFLDSTNESVMAFDTKYLGNVGELEDRIGRGQVVELHVHSNKFDDSPVILTVNDFKIEGFVAPITQISIETDRKCLIVSNVESIFKLIGKDQHDRQFNTLHGCKVIWSFDERIIERIRMAESEYKFKYLFREYEDIFVVKAREEGQFSLTAMMKCTGLTTTKNIEVIRPIRFEPEMIRMKSGETIHASLFKGIEGMKNGIRQIDIDRNLEVTRENSPEIEWETNGSDAAVFSTETYSIRGMKEGTIIITATHSRFPFDCHARLIVFVDSSET
jgi:hypothetical protein